MLELESHLENERLRLGELRKKHYVLAGVPLEQISEGNGDASSLVHPVSRSPKPSKKPTLMKKPALAQKPTIPGKTIVRVVRENVLYVRFKHSTYIMHSSAFFSFSV